MFEKFIANLKQSLPETLRKKIAGKDEIVKDEKHSEKNFKQNNDSLGSENKDSVDDKKKKQIAMLVRVLVVLGVGYLAADYFFLQEDPQNEIANIPVKPRRKKLRPKIKDEKVFDAKTAEVKPGEKVADLAEIKTEKSDKTEVKEELKSEIKEESIPEIKQEAKQEAKEEAKEEAKSSEVSAPPIENINIAPKKIEEPPTDKSSEKSSDKSIDEIPTSKNTTEQNFKADEAQSNEQLDKGLDRLIDSLDEKDKAVAEGASKKEIKLEDKIVADDVYNEPPNYDQLGRGLVYNCKGKYWACIDKTSYVNCNKNMKWNKSHGKPAECAILNVYNSDDDCGVVQKYNISTSAPTSFCK